jgi:glycosyltransferase involved in cell wall biosynthesis
MTLARAPYVVPLDADDQLTPDFLIELLTAIERDPEAAYAHCWAELFGDIKALFITRPFNPYQLLLSNPIIGCTVIRRRAWEEVGGYDETMRNGHEDWDLWIRLLKAGWTEASVRRPLFRYRKHGVSMSVLSEARFEQGRSEIVSRHPDLYELQAMKELKRAWYPLVSIISTSQPMGAISRWTIDDAELVAINDDYLCAALASQKGWGFQGPVESLQQAVAMARGKFLVVADSVEGFGPGALSRMAEALEGQPRAAGAGPNGSRSPVLWRHWTVVDRDAPHRGVVELDETGAADDVLTMGAFPKPGWDLRDDLEAIGLDLPVHRQPPEETGMIPPWVPRK